MNGYVPYFLLSYGKAIQIIEPESLKKKAGGHCVGANGILSKLTIILTAVVSYGLILGFQRKKNYESMGFQLVRKRINPDNPEVAGEHMDYELLVWL